MDATVELKLEGSHADTRQLTHTHARAHTHANTYMHTTSQHHTLSCADMGKDAIGGQERAGRRGEALVALLLR